MGRGRAIAKIGPRALFAVSCGASSAQAESSGGGNLCSVVRRQCGPKPMPQNCTQSSQIPCKSFIINVLSELCPVLGKPTAYGTEFWCPWKPLGTLWKDFSSISPFPGLRPRRELVGDQFYRYMFSMFSKLAESRFRNLSFVLTTIWKPDCDCSSESLRAAMGTLWR
jgi:hypothetical protein